MTNEELKKQIAAYCEARPEIAACYLYGSRASGKDRSDSDVDVAFLLDNTIKASDYFNLQMTYLADLGRLLRLDFHPLVMNNSGEVVLDQILKKGVAVYGGDSLECKRFRMIQSSLIAEFNPLRNRMENLLFEKYREESVHG
ncbi:MAG: nucleotidyltransferase domain-containing protein [Geobacteraceae bacterium]|nr:nucleotidyltransferase domain-containing protein [Geobacteraceae bacterium]